MNNDSRAHEPHKHKDSQEDVLLQSVDEKKPDKKRLFVIIAIAVGALIVASVALFLVFKLQDGGINESGLPSSTGKNVDVDKYRTDIKTEYFEIMGSMLKAHYADDKESVVFSVGEDLSFQKILGIVDNQMYVVYYDTRSEAPSNKEGSSSQSSLLGTIDLTKDTLDIKPFTNIIAPSSTAEDGTSISYDLADGCMYQDSIALDWGKSLTVHTLEDLKNNKETKGTLIEDGGMQNAGISCQGDSVYYFKPNSKSDRHNLRSYSFSSESTQTLNTITNFSGGARGGFVVVNGHVVVVKEYNESGMKYRSSVWSQLPGGEYQAFGNSTIVDMPSVTHDDGLIYYGDGKYIFTTSMSSKVAGFSYRLMEWSEVDGIREILDLSSEGNISARMALLPDKTLKILRCSNDSGRKCAWNYLDPASDYFKVKDEEQLSNEEILLLFSYLGRYQVFVVQ